MPSRCLSSLDLNPRDAVIFAGEPSAANSRENRRSDSGLPQRLEILLGSASPLVSRALQRGLDSGQELGRPKPLLRMGRRVLGGVPVGVIARIFALVDAENLRMASSPLMIGIWMSSAQDQDEPNT